ncbi:MAG: hydrogenase expression/formation protein HypC [Clostridia bacterium]|nr:hydrogenase expression/formation protein HypC [Clostridia bacterium]
MCLAVPAKVLAIKPDGLHAEVESQGVKATVNLSLVEGCEPGSYVLVHAGHAIAILDEVEAGIRLKLWKELADLGGMGEI